MINCVRCWTPMSPYYKSKPTPYTLSSATSVRCIWVAEESTMKMTKYNINQVRTTVKVWVRWSWNMLKLIELSYDLRSKNYWARWNNSISISSTNNAHNLWFHLKPNISTGIVPLQYTRKCPKWIRFLIPLVIQTIEMLYKV